MTCNTKRHNKQCMREWNQHKFHICERIVQNQNDWRRIELIQNKSWRNKFFLRNYNLNRIFWFVIRFVFVFENFKNIMSIIKIYYMFNIFLCNNNTFDMHECVQNVYILLIDSILFRMMNFEKKSL